jgi:transposase InsO family protein
MICRTPAIGRATAYRRGRPRARRYRCREDEVVLAQLRQMLRERGSYGCRRARRIVNRAFGTVYNRKRIQRVMRLYGLALPVRGRRRRGRRHDGRVECVISNQRWCSDVLEIACWSGEVVHLAFALDCCDREVPAHVATPHPTTGAEIRCLIRKTVVARLGTATPEVPIAWLTDNEGIYTALETVIEAERHHLAPITTPVASPESNGMAEAFVNTFKRDHVAGGDLASAARVIEQIPHWIEDYNTFAPHASLAMKAPAEFRREQQTVADTECLTKQGSEQFPMMNLPYRFVRELRDDSADRATPMARAAPGPG